MFSELKKLSFFLIALILAVIFLTAFLHHHDDGYHFHDCSVCRFIGGLQALILFLIFFAPLLGRGKFERISSLAFLSLVFTSRLQTRAPPILS